MRVWKMGCVNDDDRRYEKHGQSLNIWQSTACSYLLHATISSFPSSPSERAVRGKEEREE
jgi:hypothetical protein